MAIEGDLQDLSLAGLVQTLCLEQRTATIVLRRRMMEEGTIHFDRGEIVHATAGVLTGEDAVCHLLTWTEGYFRQSDQLTTPRRTVKSPWNHLLLEAMHRLDHDATPDAALAQTQRELTPAEKDLDRALETRFIQLLSRLEYSRSQIAARRTQARPALVLQDLTEMLNLCAQFCEEALAGFLETDYLVRAKAWAADSYPAARLLRIANNRLSAQTVAKLYTTWSDDPVGRRQVFKQMADGMVDMLETCLIRFTGSFHSPESARQWREACSGFLAELARATEEIHY